MMEVPSDASRAPTDGGRANLLLKPRRRLMRLGVAQVAWAFGTVGLIAGCQIFLQDVGLRTLIPALLALLCLQIYPVFCFRPVDLFAPPVYGGLYSALATLAMVAGLTEHGIHLRFLEHLQPER